MRQICDVAAFVPYRAIVNFRFKAANYQGVLRPYLDTIAGCGILSVCILKMESIRILGLNIIPPFGNHEFLIRLAAIAPKTNQRTFITLKSFVSAPLMATLGRFFSHYHPTYSKVWTSHAEGIVQGRPEGHTHTFAVKLSESWDHGSLFSSLDHGMSFVLDVPGSMSIPQRQSRRYFWQPITHPPFVGHSAQLANPLLLKQWLIAQLELKGVSDLIYDSAIILEPSAQVWHRSQCVKTPHQVHLFQNQG